MQSENTGKIIKKIKFNKKNIVIYFNKDDKLEISSQAFSYTYLYVGKEISYSLIKKLKEITESSKYLNYCLNLLKRGHYSEYSLREKLYIKEASKPIVDLVIKTLKNSDLINDDALAYDLYEWGNEKLEGKNKIIKTLHDKGIFEKAINKLSFPRSKEIEKAKKNLTKLELRYQKYSSESKKQHIYQALIGLGFDYDVVNEVINKVKPNSNKDEKEKLEKDYQKVVNRLKKKYEGRELNQRIIASLRNKGYRVKDIYQVLEENKYDQNDFGIC